MHFMDVFLNLHIILEKIHNFLICILTLFFMVYTFEKYFAIDRKVLLELELGKHNFSYTFQWI